jgi:hypothetical protein
VPTLVTTAVGDVTVALPLVPLTATGDPIEVPSLTQLTAGLKQSENWTVPPKLEIPVTVMVAESVSLSEEAPGKGKDAAVVGICLDPIWLGVVTVFEPQAPKFCRTKLFSVASVEVDERLSASVLAKHSFASAGNDERLMPPS